MERTTAFSNALSVFSFLCSFYPACTASFYKSEECMEVTIHVDRSIYDAEEIQNKMGDVAIAGTKISKYVSEFDKTIFISARYSID